MSSGKGRIRSAVRKGTRSDKSPRVAGATKRLHQPSLCTRCGAVFSRRTWRQDHGASPDLLARATPTVCPACRQTARGESFGCVLVRGAWAAANEAVLRRRIRNVATRARFTQPERRIESVERRGDVLEIRTTSEKLAHRIVRELLKAFRGRATYHWQERDGSLLATWRRDDGPP
jgi:hypothetical protein